MDGLDRNLDSTFKMLFNECTTFDKIAEYQPLTFAPPISGILSGSEPLDISDFQNLLVPDAKV